MRRDCGQEQIGLLFPALSMRSHRNETQFIGLNPDTAIKIACVDGLFQSRRKKMPKLEDGHIVETTLEARGAERGPTVRNMLVWSIGLVVVAFVVVYALYFKA
jgi:hypothetical protein